MSATVLAASLASAADDESKITPGLTGFLVFVALGVALWFLVRSMNRHLRRVRFEEHVEEPVRPAAPGAPGRGGSPGA